jgi:phosphate transport system substrate-binding protein
MLKVTAGNWNIGFDFGGRMKRFISIWLLILTTIITIVACKENEAEVLGDDIDPRRKIVEGFTFDNYPLVDGSTSTEPLNILLACKLLGFNYKWESELNGYKIEPVIKNVVNSMNFWKLIRTSQTHQSFINLIDKKADIILSARAMSPDEKAYALSEGVDLIETPIALDAFIFIVNPVNPITTLTIEQIQDIYTGKTTNWNEVGGNNEEIIPYIRNSNSGSQELMESIVMKDLEIMRFPESPEIIYSMIPVFEKVDSVRESICYTVYYFKEYILRGWKVKTIAIEGIYPNKESISGNSYPLTAEVYAVIRSDLDKSSTAYKLYELLQTETGKQVINESGYVPN